MTSASVIAAAVVGGILWTLLTGDFLHWIPIAGAILVVNVLTRERRRKR